MVAYSFKDRFVNPIRAGLNLSPLTQFGPPSSFPKRQTIREQRKGKSRHARPKETLQLYYGMRHPKCTLIGRALCKATSPIEMQIGADADLIVRIDRGSGFDTMSDAALEVFAAMDGFGSVEDMWLFWRKEHPETDRFRGVLIEWEAAAL